MWICPYIRTKVWIVLSENRSSSLLDRLSVKKRAPYLTKIFIKILTWCADDRVGKGIWRNSGTSFSYIPVLSSSKLAKFTQNNEPTWEHVGFLKKPSILYVVWVFPGKTIPTMELCPSSASFCKENSLSRTILRDRLPKSSLSVSGGAEKPEMCVF